MLMSPNLGKMIGLKCEACSMEFSEPSLLEHHLLLHLSKKPFECRDCSAILSSSYALLRHQRSHNQSDKVKCPLCCKELSSREHLSRHLKSRKHNPFMCDGCSAIFYRAVAFEHHKCKEPKLPKEAKPRKRQKESSAVCPYLDCSKVYSKVSNLRAHIQAFHEGKRVVCKVCCKDFAYRHTLEKHMAACHAQIDSKEENLNDYS
mmetsp:Transcript_2578/g.5860  ORF Transcript_2578/g.5860 Transcript_2578/m.5860 type:complete len:204 (-) Transcript_2578:7-618(-)